MKKIIITICCVFCFAWMPYYYLMAAMDSTNYQIWSDTFSVGGGEDQTSTNYSLQDTLDQGISSGIATSTNNTMFVGYRSIAYFSGREVLTLSLDTGGLDFGKLDKASAKTVSHTMTVETNSPRGLRVTYTGDTLTCTTCSGTIDPIGATAAESQTATSQFGFNVLYSTSSPATPHAVATTNYGQSSSYAFSSGDEVVTSSSAINPTTFIVNYIANISGSEAPGTYSTTIIYTATANF